MKIESIIIIQDDEGFLFVVAVDGSLTFTVSVGGDAVTGKQLLCST